MSDPWLSWDDGWDRYPTLAEAQAAAAKTLGDHREWARREGWPDDTDRIAWGVTLYRAVEVRRQTNTCDECEAEPGAVHEDGCGLVEEDGTVYDPEHPYTCGYELEPVPGAIEAVLGLASVEQLRAELARRLVAEAMPVRHSVAEPVTLEEDRKSVV